MSGRRSTTPLSSSQRVRYQVAKIRRPGGLDGEVLEDRCRDVDLDRRDGMPKRMIRRAVSRDAEGVGDRLRRPRHLEHDVHALVVDGLPCVGDDVGAHLLRQAEAVGVEVGGEDRRGARGLGDGNGEQPDRTAAEHGHRPAGELLLARREHGVAEGLLERRDLGRQLSGSSSRSPLGHGHVAAKAPSRSTPRISVRAHMWPGRCGRPSRRRR